MRSESTRELLANYFPEEKKTFDWKHKAVIQKPAKRRDLIRDLCGMANTEGGTVIAGIHQTDEGGLQLADFPEEEEPKLQLLHAVQRLTTPHLADAIEVFFDEVNGCTLLRIDVPELPPGQEVGFLGDDTHKPTFYHRPGDQTVEIPPESWRRRVDGARREGLREGLRKTGSGEMEASGPLNIEPAPSPGEGRLPAPAHRVAFRTDDQTRLVFGAGSNLEAWRRRLSFELTVPWESRGDQSFRDLIALAEEHLGLSTGLRFAYLIQQGRRALQGRTAAHFVHDASREDKVVERLLGAHPSNVADNVTHVDNFRPFVIGYGPCKYGIFWVGTYCKTGHLGLLLPNIPFDRAGLDKFFNAIGKTPEVYEQRADIHRYELGGTSLRPGNPTLRNPVEINLVPNEEYRSLVVADNPFHEREEELQERFNREEDCIAVNAFCKSLASLDRIIANVSGGVLRDETELKLKGIFANYVGTRPYWYSVTAFSSPTQG